MAEAEAEPPRGVVLRSGEDPRRAARLATTLLPHGVTVERGPQAGAVPGSDALAGEAARPTVPTGDPERVVWYRVPEPQTKLAI